MPETNLSFAKIVATPTALSWSQAYNAGSLFVVLSLTGEVAEDDSSLNALGKDMLSALEAEFFTLEEKSLEAIKQAITNSFEKVPSTITLSLALVFIKQNILYAYCMQQGKILLRRENKTGTILSQTSGDPQEISTASGFLQNRDTLILATKQFVSAIPKEKLLEALELELPTDIAETLSLPIHGMEEGGAASIIITFQGSSKNYVLDEVPEEEDLILAPSSPQSPSPELETTQPVIPTLPSSPLEPRKFNQFIGHWLSFQRLRLLSRFAQNSESKDLPNRFNVGYLKSLRAYLPFKNFQMNHRKKLALSVIILLVAMLIVSIFMTTRQRTDTKQTELFTKVYPSAQKDYQEGEGLLSLNKNLARDDFLAAQKKLSGIKDTFPKDSKENQQIQDLLKKVDMQLQGASGIQPTSLKEVSADTNKLLSYSATHTNTPVTEDTSFLYTVSEKGITRIDKGNDQTKSIVTNDGDWAAAKSIGVYLGNIYLLDPKNGVLKYVDTGNDYSKNSYFPKDTKPDTSKAVSLTIDGSIWLLTSDGTIEKFTKGKQDTFTFSGLDKPFKNPVRIYTNEDITTLYVLDAGNSRIVKLSKDGTYQAQYVGRELANATDFIVNEKDKKITVLSGGKLYELSL